jgi:uncharacterized protein
MRTFDGPRPDGLPCWLDLAVPSAVEAAAFYERLFGWRYDVSGPEFGSYHVARSGDRAAAGIGQVPTGDAAPSAWTLYFAADDVAVRSEHARELGGTIVMAPLEIPGQGSMAIVQDPTGAPFGLWQASGHSGFGAVGMPGTMAWCELNTRDAGAAEAFYTKLLGVDAAAVDGTVAEYRALGRGDERLAGILPMGLEREGVPPHWLVFFAVADADRAADAIRAGGGLVSDGPFGSTFGRVVVATDPFGAVFALLEEPPEV